MSEATVDSRTAARSLTYLLGVSVLIGAVTGMATWLFIVADHFGIQLFWHDLPSRLTGVPAWAVTVGVVVVMTVAATLVVVSAGRRPFDMGEAEAEYDEHGRMEYRHVIAGSLFSLFSLFSGAAVGPEAPLTDINGGLGTLIAEKLGLQADQVKVMAYAGVAGAFSAFFGAAPVGALLAIELISPRSLTISRTMIVSGLGSGATAWVVYVMLGGEKISPILQFPPYHNLQVRDLLLGVILGIAGALLGLVYGGALVRLRVGLQKLRSIPWLAALAGGGAVLAAALFAPALLFSGQSEVPRLLENAATIGALALIGLGVAKLALSAWSLSTAYFGGPIFPLIFAGTSFGLAVSLLVPVIPQQVAVLGVTTGMVVAAAVAPLSVTVFLSLISDPSLTSVIAIAAVSAYVARQLVAPTLPGVYRATQAEERRTARDQKTS